MIILDREYIKEYFEEWLDETFYKILDPIRKFRDKFRMRFITKRHIVKTTLYPYGWHDSDEILLYSNMQILKEFVEKEEPFETCDYDSDEPHRKAKKTIEEIYTWWMNYEKRQLEIKNTLTQWAILSEILSVNTYPKLFKIIKGDCDYLFKKLDELETTLRKEETIMMKKLIDIRGFLWT